MNKASVDSSVLKQIDRALTILHRSAHAGLHGNEGAENEERGESINTRSFRFIGKENRAI